MIRVLKVGYLLRSSSTGASCRSSAVLWSDVHSARLLRLLEAMDITWGEVCAQSGLILRLRVSGLRAEEQL